MLVTETIKSDDAMTIIRPGDEPDTLTIGWHVFEPATASFAIVTATVLRGRSAEHRPEAVQRRAPSVPVRRGGGRGLEWRRGTDPGRGRRAAGPGCCLNPFGPGLRAGVVEAQSAREATVITRTRILSDPNSGAHALAPAGYIPPAPVITDFEPESVYRAGAAWEALRWHCTGSPFSPGGDQGDFFEFTKIVIWGQRYREDGRYGARKHLATITRHQRGHWMIQTGSFGGMGYEPVADEFEALGEQLARLTDYPLPIEVHVTRPGNCHGKSTFKGGEAQDLLSLARAHRAGVVLVHPEDVAALRATWSCLRNEP